MRDYLIRFEPVAGAQKGMLYAVYRKPNAGAAIEMAKARHAEDFGSTGVHRAVDTVQVWDGNSRTRIDITTEVET